MSGNAATVSPSPRPRVRAGIVQWQMRDYGSRDALLRHALHFIDTLADAGAQLVLLPEFFSVPLLAPAGSITPRAAMEALADETPALVDALGARAVARGLWIVAGSLPLRAGSQLLNSAFVLGPQGQREVQHKLHVTPGEHAQWGIIGGDGLRVIDTPIGRLGVLVCYDIEFPEAARVLADQGVDILCVPSWTDIRAGFLRVQRCAAARAIENECYVLLSGSTGYLAGRDGIDSQYTQSAVFTPADIPFPPDAVLAQADANSEQYLLADLDLGLLDALREHGAVRNGKDRRRDLLSVSWRGR